jgi:hypothetical protein
MVKGLSAALVFVLLLGSSLRASQAGEWVKVSPLGGGFSIMMPAKPEEGVKSDDDFTSHLFTVTTPNGIYLAGYGDYAPSIRLDVDSELSVNRDKFIKGVNATLSDSRKITLDGHPGLEFTAESDQASFKSRIYLWGNRVHQIAVATINGKDDSANLNRFFASFAFTSNNSHSKP